MIGGLGADTLDITLAPMAGTAEVGGWIWTGDGADAVKLAASGAATGGWVEVWSGAGDDDLDLTPDGDGFLANAGSGHDTVALHGWGGTAGAAATIDGAVGIDTAVLEGIRAQWSFAALSDEGGNGVLASHAALGSFALRNL